MNFAVLFPGQGSQYVGMGQSLVMSFPVAAAIFKKADEILGFSLSELCFYGPEEELTDTANSQSAIFVTSLAAWYALCERLGDGKRPGAFAGHSLGEYSALVAAGALEFESALQLVRARGLAMAAAGKTAPGGMSAVLGMELRIVAELCNAVCSATGLVVEIANDNCPGQIVIAGERRGLDAFADMCVERGLTPPRPLKVSVAPHTSLMERALPVFLEKLANTPISAPSTPVVGNISADWLETAELVRLDLQDQLTHTVRWTESMQCLIERGVDTIVDVGPGKVLAGLMRYIDRNIKRISIDADPRNFQRAIDEL